MKSADYCYGEITPTPPPTNLPTSNPTSVPTSLPSFNPTSNPTAVVSSSLIFFYLICCIQNSFWVYVNENIMRSYDVATSSVLGTAHISGTNMHILFYIIPDLYHTLSSLYHFINNHSQLPIPQIQILLILQAHQHPQMWVNIVLKL